MSFITKDKYMLGFNVSLPVIPKGFIQAGC